MCFGCSKETSHRDGSFEYPQHMFWLRNKENNYQVRTVIWGPVCPALSEPINSYDGDFFLLEGLTI